jgi:hypothetical protein
VIQGKTIETPPEQSGGVFYFQLACFSFCQGNSEWIDTST